MVKVPKKKLRTNLILGIGNIISSIVAFYFIFKFSERPFYVKLLSSILPLGILSVGIILLLELKSEKKIIRILSIPFMIFLIPFIVVSAFSQSYYYRILVLPQLALGIIMVLSTGFFKLVELLNIGNDFNLYVIPYLNFTTIITTFSYADTFLVNQLANRTPNDQMPQSIKDETFQFLKRKPFVKIVYLIMTILVLLTSIEELGKITILSFLYNYKKVVLQTLISFIAIDRCVSKWK